jgi:hypothetical protein
MLWVVFQLERVNVSCDDPSNLIWSDDVDTVTTTSSSGRKDTFSPTDTVLVESHSLIRARDGAPTRISGEMLDTHSPSSR